MLEAKKLKYFFMHLNELFKFKFVIFYVLVFFTFIFIFNELMVNEEFYISIGLLVFLLYLIVLSIKSLMNYLNVRVKNDFFIFVGIHEYVYTHFVDLFKFFKFDLYFWVLLYNLYKLLYNYKKFLTYENLAFNYIYEYTKNILISLVLEKYTTKFYNQVILTSLHDIHIISLNRLMEKYLKKSAKKTFMKKKYLSITQLLKKIVVV